MTWEDDDAWADDEPWPQPVYRSLNPLTTVYHDSHSLIPAWRWYADSSEAQAAGLRPCGTCRPL